MDFESFPVQRHILDILCTLRSYTLSIYLLSVVDWSLFTGRWWGEQVLREEPIIFLPLNISPVTCTVLPFRCSQQKKGPYCVSGHPLTCDLNTSLPTSSNCPPPSALLHRSYHLQTSFNTSVKNSNNKTHRILSWSHSLPQIYYFSTPFLSKLS